MRWLSIKSYVIPHDTYLIFRFKHNDGTIRIGSGSFRYYDGKDVSEFDYDVYAHWKITHFCIPDAVEAGH